MTSDLPPSPVYNRHNKYYIPGGDLNIIVGTSRFRIHSHFLIRESTFWGSLLDLFMKEAKAPGRRESNPITLDDDSISSQDFASFLWVFYNERYGIYETELGNWLSILSLATKWKFNEVQRFAIDHLESIGMDVVTRIKLYTDHHVPQIYIAPYYEQLACRQQLLTSEEFHMLSPDTVYRIVTAREILRAPPPVQEDDLPLSPIRDGFNDTSIQDTIFSVFDITPPPGIN